MNESSSQVQRRWHFDAGNVCFFFAHWYYWEHVLFFPLVLKWLVLADNTEWNQSWLHIKTVSTNEHKSKHTHTHTAHRSNSRDENSSSQHYVSIWLLTLWPSHAVYREPVIMCPHTGLQFLICHIRTHRKWYVQGCAAQSHKHILISFLQTVIWACNLIL